MKVRIRYFASVREALSSSGETVDTQAATLAELRDELIARGGAYATALARGKAVRMALDQLMSDEATPLNALLNVPPNAPLNTAPGDDCEVAFFPPVTGG